MKVLKYKVEFLSYWHTGSGLSSGTDSDLVVIKDKNQLPFIPGKTMKGLLREAAEIIHEFDNNLVTNEFINTVFGEKSDEDKDNITKEAQSFFTDATLSEKVRIHLNNNEEQKKYLYRNIASTKIDSEGQTEDHSLRQMEVSIPLELYATIIDFPEEYDDQIKYCMKWVKRMGLNRSRGLGICRLQTV